MKKKNSPAFQLTIKYAFLQSLFWIIYAIIGSFANVYLLDRGFYNTEIGIILSAGAVLSIIFQSILAALIDQFQKVQLKYVIFVLLLLLFLSVTNLSLHPNNKYITGGCYILIFTILTAMISFLNSFAMEYINLGIDLNYGLARGMGSISFALIAYIIGHIIEKLGSGIILPASMLAVAIMIGITLSFRLPATYEAARQNEPAVTGTKKEKKLNFFTFFMQYRQFFLLLTGFSLLYIGHSFINTYHINIIQNVGGNSSNLGLSISIAAIVELPAMASFAFLSSKTKCSTLIKISAAFFAIKALITFVAPNIGFIYFSMVFQMGSFALFTPSSIYYVNKIMDRSNRVKGQALLGTATLGIGGTLGNFIGGKLLDTFSVSVMLAVGLILSIIGFIVTLIFTDRNVE
ncbi:MAG: MFS transporter [Lachnospiraceae bacterium]|jgi:PPP family 3-phenylpropionic acid transporter|nr:MFS transporter [Lachnospiraceae bacterium]